MHKKSIVIFSISTKDYSKHAEIALQSFAENCSYNIDIKNITLEEIIEGKYNNIHIKNFINKYKLCSNKLRWSLKPVLIRYFLTDAQYDISIYIDNDLYFVNNVDFLIKDINKGILLTKHNRPLYPSNDIFLNNQFLCNFTDGFFNAGFVGANLFGLKAIEWWSDMNYWQCSKIKNYGLYDDQKYLDIMALHFNKCINICEHPGCNLATWNSGSVKRSLVNDRWIIEDHYDPIFCHFSDINNRSVNDPMLYSFYQEYKNKIDYYV